MAWIRLDTDFFTNDEVCNVTHVTRYTVTAVIAYVKMQGAGGIVKATPRQIARTMDVPEENVKEALKTTFFEVDGKLIQVLHWQEFQRDNTAAERMARHRRNVTECNVTQRNVTPTGQDRTGQYNTDNTPLPPSSPKTKPKRKPQTPPPITEGLRNPVFQQAWDEWHEYRTQAKKKLTPSTAAKQLNRLAQHAPDTAAAMLNQSIENGWTGIFDLKDNGNGKRPKWTQAEKDRAMELAKGQV